MSDFKKIRVKEGQSLFDISAQEYGSIEFVFDLVQDNPELENIDASLYSGQYLKIRQGVSGADMATAAYSQSQGGAGTVTRDIEIQGDFDDTDFSNDFNT